VALSSIRCSRSTLSRSAGAAAACALALLVASDARSFAGLVSPPRFELKAKAGDVIRQVLEIGNDAAIPDEFAVSTADWTLNAKGGVDFSEPLAAGSCRPWVRIERHVVAMQPRAVRKFRFEVHIPPDAPAQECRFAIVVEKAKPAVPEVVAGNIQFPLQGRIGVIVYVAVGDVLPKLELRGVGLQDFNGRLTPSATFHNGGTSHGRPEGVLDGVDASGKSYEFVVSPFPILPGETRSVAIWPQEAPDRKAPDLVYPLRLKGTIEWEGGKQAIDSTIGAGSPVKAGSS
jgi:fimbrial chaperone protein